MLGAVRVHFHGNCQMNALSMMLREAAPHWDVSNCIVHEVDPANEQARVLADLRAADIVVAQPVAADYRGVDWLATGFTLSEARPGAGIVTMPSLYFGGLAPEYVPFRVEQPPSGYPFSDYQHAVAADMVLAGFAPDQIVARATDPDLFDRDTALGIIAQSLADLRMREDVHRTDVRASDIIDELCRAVPVMHTLNHPRRIVLARLLNRLLAHLGEAPRAGESGCCYLNHWSFPTMPAIARHLDGAARAAPDDVVIDGQPMTLATYCRAMSEGYAQLPPALLARIAHEPHGRGFPTYLRRCDPTGLHAARDAGEALVAGIYAALLGRAATPMEIASNLAAARLMGGEAVLRGIFASPEFAARRDEFMASLPAPKLS